MKLAFLTSGLSVWDHMVINIEMIDRWACQLQQYIIMAIYQENWTLLQIGLNARKLVLFGLVL